MHQAGLIVWEVLNELRMMVEPGISTLDLDKVAEQPNSRTQSASGFQRLPGISGFLVRFD